LNPNKEEMMKKYYVILLLPMSILSNNLFAQSNPETELASQYRVNFSIPDAPAFKLLGADPSNILKPASVRELAIGFSEFLGSDNSIILTKSFALEFSPGLLIGGKKLTLKNYQKNPWMYRTRISIATNQSENENKATTLAFGIRVTKTDESDLRTKKNYEEESTRLAKQINDYISIERKRLGPTIPLDEIKELPEVKKEI